MPGRTYASRRCAPAAPVARWARSSACPPSGWITGRGHVRDHDADTGRQDAGEHRVDLLSVVQVDPGGRVTTRKPSSSADGARVSTRHRIKAASVSGRRQGSGPGRPAAPQTAGKRANNTHNDKQAA